MYLSLMYCIKAVVCRLHEMLYSLSCNVVISCWKSGAYDIVICRGGTDMCFVPGSGWKHVDLEQCRISGLTDHNYYGLCDLGSSVSAIPFSLYQEIMHEILPSEIEYIYVIIHL